MVVSFEMVLPGLAGYWLDQWLGTKVLLMLVGFALGATAAAAHLIRLTRVEKNRPVDDTYRPHRPVTQDGPEAGHYWVTASSRSQFSGQYRHWARITVVGRVVGTWSTSTGSASGGEPVLSLLYAKGWTSDGKSHDNAWEISTDPNAIMNVPAGLGGEFGPAP